VSAERRQIAGAQAIAAALEDGLPVRLLLVREGELSTGARAVISQAGERGASVREVGAREMKRMAAPSPAGEEPELVALVGPEPETSLEDLVARGGALWLLVGVAYPGNAGYAIRTAEVSGATGIVIDAPFDHAGRRQALRASMRTDRFFPVLFESAEALLSQAKAGGRRIVGVEDTGSRAPWETDLTGSLVLVVGGEAGGVPAELQASCDELVRIPMAGFVPSYNLQAAMAIVAGERLRQQERPLQPLPLQPRRDPADGGV
jgi:tRNA G18 (ribose-2'-O)-methylase SpoU